MHRQGSQACNIPAIEPRRPVLSAEQAVQGWGYYPRTPGISPSAIGLALETLDAASFLEDSLFGKLTHYTNLKSLAIPEPFLASGNASTIHGKLPSQLEELQLQYPMGLEQDADERRAIRHTRIRNLIAFRSASLQKLRRVIWWYQQAECWAEAGGGETRYGGAAKLSRFITHFKERGVNFEWLSEPYCSRTPFGKD